jgi:pimeloyl-ACP methyl ester carboxylesterase
VLEHDRHAALEVMDRILSISTKLTKSERLALVSHPSATENCEEEVGLHLRNDGTFSQAASAQGKYGENFVSDYAIAACFFARFDESITPAELDLLKNLLCGASLRRASQDDGRSYQTKRNQLAALRSKAQVSSQAELLQIVSVLLTSLVNSGQDSAEDPVSRLKSLLDQYYQPHARLHRTTFESGRELLVADLGPLDGQPCFLMHPSVEPLVPLPNRADFLESANIRVLIPLRPGFFGRPLDKTHPEMSLSDFVDDCFMFLTSFGLTSLPIVSITAGGMSAMLLADRLGESCEQLLMCSPQYFARSPRPAKSSYSGHWAQLIGRFQWLLFPVFNTLAPLLLNEEFARKIWLKTYENSPDDIKHVLSIVRSDWAPDFARAMIDCNLGGVEADLLVMAGDWVDSLGALKCRTMVYYGETDPFSDHEYTKGRLEAVGVEVRIVPGFGQNSFLNRPDVLFDHLAGHSPIV